MTQTHNDHLADMLSDLSIAHDLLKHQLPPEIYARVDWSTLSLENNTLKDFEGKRLETDRIFKAKIQNRDGYLAILLEHQSTHDRTMPLRIWQYMLGIAIRHLKMHKTKTPPIIIPVLIHQNPRPYRAARRVVDMYPTEMRDWAQQLWNEPFHLLNVVQTDDKVLLQHGAAASLLMALKTVDLINPKAWLDMVKFLGSYACDYGYQRAKNAIMYMLKVDRKITDNIAFKEELIVSVQQELSPRGEENMSIAEHLQQEGFEKGIERGIEKGAAQNARENAVNLLKEGVDFRIIARATGLSEYDVKKLRQKLVD